MILVTGGCGYIGSHIVNALSLAGESVIVFDDLSHGRREALLHGEELVVGSVTNPADLNAVFTTHSIDYVIHLAALVNASDSVAFPSKFIQVNEEGTKNVLHTAIQAGIKSFIFASSAAVYGTPTTASPLPETSILNPTNPYGQTKLASENLIQKLAEENQFNFGIFRFFNVAGASATGKLYQDPANNAIISRLLIGAATGKTVEISGNDYDTSDGTVVRDFVHVEDIAAAHLLALKHLSIPHSSFILNLGSSIPTTLKTLANLVEEVTGKTIHLHYGERKAGDISYSLSDITQTKTVLNWSPAHDLRSIITDAWRAYCENF